MSELFAFFVTVDPHEQITTHAICRHCLMPYTNIGRSNSDFQSDLKKHQCYTATVSAPTWFKVQE